MASKPKRASEYTSEQAELVKATCLYLATKLGDLLDEIVIVGGLVPSLIVDQAAPEGTAAHVGTIDLDVGLEVALLHEERYRRLTERLRNAQFEQDHNEDGNATRHRWCVADPAITLDFLIPPSLPSDQGGMLRHIEKDFAAVITPGLDLAFRDQERIKLEGRTILGARASRDVRVCGPGAFIVLKALAFYNRTENKDAYDLFYVLQNYGAGVDDVAYRLKPLLDDPSGRRAVEVLRRDFLDPAAVGPVAVSEFLEGRREAGIQADVVGFVMALLKRLEVRP